MVYVRRKGYLYGQSLTCWWGAFTREKLLKVRTHPSPSHSDPQTSTTLCISTLWCPCLSTGGLHIFAMTQSQQNQGSSLLCPAANDSACSHTQQMVRTASSGLYWFIGARVTLSSLACHVALPGWLDLGIAAQSQGEEARRWREARPDRSPSCVLSSSYACRSTGWRPMGPRDPGHQGTWRLYSKSM